MLVFVDEDVSFITVVISFVNVGAEIGPAARAGGIGETRVALEVARSAMDEWTNGVWLVELAALSDAALVAGTMLMAAGGLEASRETATETLLRHLRDKHMLLLIDNCEHLLHAVTQIAESTALISSRKRFTGQG